MTTMVGLYLSPETAEDLKGKALKGGLTISALADLALRYGLARLADDAIAAYAAKLPRKRGALGGGLRASEQAALRALEALTVGLAWRLSHEDIAATAGLGRLEAYKALTSLAGRGLVRPHPALSSPELDRWGRPVKTFWSLPGAGSVAQAGQ